MEPKAEGAVPHPLIGEPLPEFEVAAASGEGRVSSALLAGKPGIVDFWATWCVPCRESFPAYEALSKKYAGQIVVVGISVDDDPAGIPAFAQETGVRFPLGWDEGQVVAKRYDPPSMPSSYLVDRSGIVRRVHDGFRAGDGAIVEQEILELLR